MSHIHNHHTFVVPQAVITTVNDAITKQVGQGYELELEATLDSQAGMEQDTIPADYVVASISLRRAPYGAEYPIIKRIVEANGGQVVEEADTDVALATISCKKKRDRHKFTLIIAIAASDLAGVRALFASQGYSISKDGDLQNNNSGTADAHWARVKADATAQVVTDLKALLDSFPKTWIFMFMTPGQQQDLISWLRSQGIDGAEYKNKRWNARAKGHAEVRTQVYNNAQVLAWLNANAIPRLNLSPL